eukprot:32977-Alexandrium_andersonii.AAC.1
MSASLVGSEMCIRDRCKQLKTLWDVLRRCLKSPETVLKLPKAALGAVSYTHLTLPTICSV